MADASQVFSSLIPAGNGSSATTTKQTPLGLSRVRRVLITYPYGCAGLVGVQIRAADGYAFPNQQNTFIAFDDYVYPFEVTGQIDGGNWSVVAYNKDILPHTIQVVYEYDYVRQAVAQSSSNPISL